jgi:hypothetical protein
MTAVTRLNGRRRAVAADDRLRDDAVAAGRSTSNTRMNNPVEKTHTHASAADADGSSNDACYARWEARVRKDAGDSNRNRNEADGEDVRRPDRRPQRGARGIAAAIVAPA